MKRRYLTLELLSETFAVAQLEGDSPVPAWVGGTLISVTRARGELSIVCVDSCVPSHVKARHGFRCLRVVGPLEFSEIGVLASLAGPLSCAGISIFALSTYDTDYLLLGVADLEPGLAALVAAGHSIRRHGAA